MQLPCCAFPNHFVFYRALFLVVPVLDHYNQHMRCRGNAPRFNCCQRPVQLVTDGIPGAVALLLGQHPRLLSIVGHCEPD